MFMSPYPMVPALSDLCHFHFAIFMLYRRRQNNNFALKKTKWPQCDKTKKNTRRQTQPSNFRMSFRSSFRAAISFNPLSSLKALSNFHRYWKTPNVKRLHTKLYKSALWVRRKANKIALLFEDLCLSTKGRLLSVCRLFVLLSFRQEITKRREKATR